MACLGPTRGNCLNGEQLSLLSGSFHPGGRLVVRGEPVIVSSDLSQMHLKQQSADFGASPPREETTLVELVRRQATTFGDKIAFRFVRGTGEEVSLTFRGLHERAMAIAGELQSRVISGARVVLLFPPGLEFIEAFFGCLYAGVIAVPVATPGRKRPPASLLAIVASSQPALLLSTAEYCERGTAAADDSADLPPLPWLATEGVPTTRQSNWREASLKAHHTAFLQYTSGSTASPKGVVLSHANLLSNAALIHRAFGNTCDDTAVFWLPLYHDMGLIGGVIQPLYCGGTCTLVAAATFLQRPALWLELISQTRATISGGPDFAYDLCCRKVSAAELARLDLSSWQVAFTGAERIRAKTLERFAAHFAPCGFRREAFFPCYGLAEATLMVSGGPRGVAPTVAHVTEDSLARHQTQEASPAEVSTRSMVGCGQNLPGQRIMIVDPDSRQACPDGTVGEIWVQGPSVAGGYYERPEATAEVFGARLADTGEGPFLRTGDLGFLRGGQLFVTGRQKDLIIIRGRNYYPEDIEHSLDGAFAGLRAGYCAAFSVDSEDREQLVVVHEVEPRARELDTDAALQAIRQAVAARHEVEVHAVVLVKAGTVPKTSSGKTRRSACRELYLNQQLAPLALWEAAAGVGVDEAVDPEAIGQPRTVTAREIEVWLTQRIAARLRLSIERVRITTPFLEFGMGSLDAVELAAELGRWLGRRLSPTAIYNHPNIASLSRWLAETPSGVEPSEVRTPTQQMYQAFDPEQCLADVRRLTEDQLAAFVQEEMAKLTQTSVGVRSS